MSSFFVCTQKENANVRHRRPMVMKNNLPFTYYLRKEYYIVSVERYGVLADNLVFEDKRDAERYAQSCHGVVNRLLVHPKGTLTWVDSSPSS